MLPLLPAFYQGAPGFATAACRHGHRLAQAQSMIPKKHARRESGGGYRFPACAKPWHGLLLWLDASAGEGRSEKIMLHQ
jgi:hypothetical protein